MVYYHIHYFDFYKEASLLQDEPFDRIKKRRALQRWKDTPPSSSGYTTGTECLSLYIGL